MPNVNHVSGPQPALRKWKSFLMPSLQLTGFLSVCVPRPPSAQDSQECRDAIGTLTFVALSHGKHVGIVG